MKTADGETVVDFVTLTASDLTQTIENELENVQYVVVNNPDYSNRENLVLFFAEVNGEELSIKGTTSSKAERIISMMNVKLNADKKYYIEYTVLILTPVRKRLLQVLRLLLLPPTHPSSPTVIS